MQTKKKKMAKKDLDKNKFTTKNLFIFSVASETKLKNVVCFFSPISFTDFTQSLRLVEVRIPNYVIKGSTAQLECLYDLDGEALYSVKWYKDGNEFYRYVPRDMPPAQTFILPGVSVDVSRFRFFFLHTHTLKLILIPHMHCNTRINTKKDKVEIERGRKK